MLRGGVPKAAVGSGGRLSARQGLAPLRAVSSPQKLADSEKCSQGAVKMAGAQ